MKFRWLGEACVEIVARRHLLVDPNFRLDPQPDVDLILVTHEHDDHFRAYPIHYDPDEKLTLAQQLVEKIRAQGVESATLAMGEWVELTT